MASTYGLVGQQPLPNKHTWNPTGSCCSPCRALTRVYAGFFDESHLFLQSPAATRPRTVTEKEARYRPLKTSVKSLSEAKSLCFPMQTQSVSRQTCGCVVQSGRELLLHASCSTKSLKSTWNSEPSEPASSSQTENLFFRHSDLSLWDPFSLPMKEVGLLCISHSPQAATVEDSRHLPTFTGTSSCATQLPYFLCRWAFRICYPTASGDWSCSLCSDKLFFIKVDGKRLWVPIQHESEGETF